MEHDFAVVFPGQGSQSVGMMRALAGAEPDVRRIFERAGAALGYDLLRIVNHGPEAELNRTEITQPALLAAAYASWRLCLEKTDRRPALLAGHSLGEYTALVSAGVIGFEDALWLVAERGRCMQAAVPAGCGAMAAIVGLEDAEVEAICREVSAAGADSVAPANYNSPGQVVVAGQRAGVDRAVARAKAAGARRAVRLPVSVPSHCDLMREAARRFSGTLNSIEFKDAEIPVIQNVDATARTRADEIKPGLLAQLYQPVQWVNCVRAMQARQVKRIIECGPGRVLAGLIKRIDRALIVEPCREQSFFGHG